MEDALAHHEDAHLLLAEQPAEELRERELRRQRPRSVTRIAGNAPGRPLARCAYPHDALSPLASGRMAADFKVASVGIGAIELSTQTQIADPCKEQSK